MRFVIKVSDGGRISSFSGSQEEAKDFLERMFRRFQDSGDEQMNIYIDKEEEG